MVRVFTNKVVRTRKAHACAGCCAEIPKGSLTEHTVGIFDGEFFSSYLCDICKLYMERHGHKYRCDGYMVGEFLDDEDWHEVKKEVVGNK